MNTLAVKRVAVKHENFALGCIPRGVKIKKYSVGAFPEEESLRSEMMITNLGTELENFSYYTVAVVIKKTSKGD